MNQKKTIIILIFILLVGIIGLTVAYFSNTTSINNLFSTNPYGTTVEEVFTSPSNWLPGTTTDKEITVTNSGSVDEAVRISYFETWKAKDNTILSGLIDQDGNLTSTEENSEHAAIINFSNNNDWTYDSGYYYYNYKLSPNETTSSLIDSVTFNSKVKNSSNCTTVENNGTKTITCNSTNSGYDGATYTLTFTIETVQFDKYKQAWGVDVAILNEQALFCDAFDVGEVVEYNNAEYYVLKDSSTSDDYVTLLKKDPLTVSEVNQYSTDYVSQDGEYPYYTSDTCNESNQTGCSTNYDTSDVKKIVDGWSSSFSDDLVSIDGYKTRLIDEDDLISNLAYEFQYNSPYDGSGAFTASYETPLWAYINEKKYWSMNENGDSSSQINTVYNKLFSENIYNKFYIRPIINLKKSVINGMCKKIGNPHLYCSFGSKITYNNEEYYVMQDFNNYVVALKKENLSKEILNELSEEYTSIEGEYPYLMTDTCNSSNKSECDIDYDESSVKKIVNAWSNEFKKDLMNDDGYKARLINENDLVNYLKFTYSNNKYIASSETPRWVGIYESYWTMIGYTGIHPSGNPLYNSYNVYQISLNADGKSIYFTGAIRPVINLKKSAIDSGCSIKYLDDEINESNDNINDREYATYSVGQSIIFNDENYCVLSKSKSNQNYVTLIKHEPLTYDELVTYNNGYELGRDSVDNNSGIISYYKSDTCYYNSDSDKNTSGCSNDYNTSFVRTIVNNWSNSIIDSLVEIDGYKARLITNDELRDMGHIVTGTTEDFNAIKSSYDCLYSDADYWTMSTNSDGYEISIVSKIDNNNRAQFVDKKHAVRPVINLKKCAIDGTC